MSGRRAAVDPETAAFDAVDVPTADEKSVLVGVGTYPGETYKPCGKDPVSVPGSSLDFGTD